MKRVVLAIGVFAVAFSGETRAMAGLTPAFTTTSTTGTSLGNPPFTLGFEFTTTQAITVTQLGLFDDSQDGLVDSHAVGLYDMNGNLLASTTIDSGTTDPLVDQFRYKSIASVNLAAGQEYFIGALYLTGDDAVLFPGEASNFVTAPAITFVESTYAGGSTLSPPQASVSSLPGYFGPNFIFSPVPEPASIAMVGIGVACVGLSCRRAGRSA